jgi:hypothetical protein
MNAYQITNTTSAADLGVYTGNTETEALDACARDAGCADYASASAEFGGGLIATLVTADNAAELMAGVEPDQDWASETSIYRLHDGARVAVSGATVTVIPALTEEEVATARRAALEWGYWADHIDADAAYTREQWDAMTRWERMAIAARGIVIGR